MSKATFQAGLAAGIVSGMRFPMVVERVVEKWETLFEREIAFDTQHTTYDGKVYYGAHFDTGYYPLDGYDGYPVRVTIDNESKVYMLCTPYINGIRYAGIYSYIGDTEFNIHFHWLSDSGDFWDKRIVFYGAFTGNHNVRVEVKTSARLAGYQYPSGQEYRIEASRPVFPAIPDHNEVVYPYAILWETDDGRYYLTLSASSIEGSTTEDGNDTVFRWLQSGVALRRYEVVNGNWELQSEAVTTDALITDYWCWYNHDWTFTDWLYPDDPWTNDYEACHAPIPVYK